MKKCTAALLIITILISVSAACFAEVLMPEPGNRIKKSGMLTVDFSNCSEGYVMARAKPTGKTLKLRVVHEKMDLYYNLNSDGEYEVFPLQDGSGRYVFTLYEKLKGNQYRKLSTVSLAVDMPDPERCYLYPNQYINYTPDTPAVIRAWEVCEGLTDPVEKAHAIYRDVFVGETEVQDVRENGEVLTATEYEVKFKYRQIDNNELPNIDKAFETHAGSCKDQSGLYVAMLRSAGVPAMYAVLNGDASHAWVILILNGKKYSIDPILELPFCLRSADEDLEYADRTY